MPSSSWSRFERLVGSRRVAQWSLGTWVALFVVWVVPFTLTGVPEPRIKRIVGGEWYFQLLYGVLLVNVLVCLLPRWRRALRSARLPSPLPADRLAEHRRSVGARCAATPGALGGRLADGGWTVVVDERAGALAAVRRRFSTVGSLLLHLSLALVLVAAFLVPRTTTGQVLVSEGESFSGAPEDYAQKPEPPPGRALPRAAFTVEKLRADFFEDKLFFKDLRAAVTHRRADATRTATVRLSEPLFFGPGTFVSLAGFNHALAYTLDGESRGRAVRREIVGVDSFPPGSEDKIRLLVGQRLSIHWAYVRVYPDVPEDGPSLHNISFAVGRPKLAVRMTRLLDDGTERPLGSWVVRLGEPIRFDRGTLTFDAIKYAGLFRLVDVPSLPWMSSAFIVGLVGLVWRTLLPREELYLARGREGDAEAWVLVGRVDYDRASGRGLALRWGRELGMSVEAGS